MPEATFNVVPDYPLDPRDLLEIYTNWVVINATKEELYLDVCQVQPQTMNASKEGNTVAGTVRIRVVLGREHARRLAAAIVATLEGRSLGAQT